jgi:tRNA A-37 threonylcarbamoyl transferase component Bud32
MKFNSIIPEGYNYIEKKDYRLALIKGADLAIKDGCEKIIKGEQAGVPASDRKKFGRALVNIIDLKNGDRAILRHYYRGGLVRHFVKDIFLGGGRALKELYITEKARLGGVETVEILAAVEYRVEWNFWQCSLITREIPDCQDLGEFMKNCQSEEPASQLSIITQLAAIIRKTHGLNIFHADLQVKNILIQTRKEQTKIFLIDFDKAKQFNKLTPVHRQQQLMRLSRSMEKFSIPIKERQKLAFLKAYENDSGSLNISPQDFLKKSARHTAIHRFLWKKS